MKPLIATLALAVLAPSLAVARAECNRGHGPESLLCVPVCGRPDGWADLLGRLGWPRGPLLALLVEQGMCQEEVELLLSPDRGHLAAAFASAVTCLHSQVIYDRTGARWLTVGPRSGPEGAMRVRGVYLGEPPGPCPPR